MRLPKLIEAIRGCRREVTPKQWRSPSARANIARRYIRVKLWYYYRVKPKTRENPVNYAHRIWLKNRRFVHTEETQSYQKAIVKNIKRMEAGKNHQALLKGKASDTLINQTIENYSIARKEWGWQ